jgi:hypothetical protein
MPNHAKHDRHGGIGPASGNGNSSNPADKPAADHNIHDGGCEDDSFIQGRVYSTGPTLQGKKTRSAQMQVKAIEIQATHVKAIEAERNLLQPRRNRFHRDAQNCAGESRKHATMQECSLRFLR